METSNECCKRNVQSGAEDPFRDALLALTALNHDTVLLDYGNVIVRRGYKDLKTVRLLSGGVAGDDLSLALLVGKGMLTAAILGEQVTPGSRQILHTIRELHESENCGVFVVSRSGSELFNFGLAVERTSAECRMRVKLLPVSDNRHNGTCSFVLLIKILGALAEEGAFFDDIWKLYNHVVREMISVPLQCTTLKEDAFPARESISIALDFDRVFNRVIDSKSQSNLRLHPSHPSIAMINFSKSLSKSEELKLTKQVIERLRELGVCIIRLYSGNFVSVPPQTASLTLMKVYDNKIVEYLDAPCDAPGWQRVVQYLPEVTLANEVPGVLTHQGKQHVPLKGPRLTDAQINILIKSVQFACEALMSCERQLNLIDSERGGDSNVGSRLAKLAEYLKKRLVERRITIDRPYVFFKKLGVMAESAMGGTMGSIYGVLFENAALFFEALPEDEEVTAETWAKALAAAEDAVGRYVSEERASRTMCCPIKACRMAVESNTELSFFERFDLGVSQAEEAAQTTRTANRKYADAGAHAVGIWMRAVFEGVKLICSGESPGHKNDGQ